MTAALSRDLFLHRPYVARCSCGSFAVVQELFRKNRAGRSIMVKLFAPPNERAELQRQGLPLMQVVRFVSLRLSTGELEVLATSLLGERKYPTEDFQALYHRRWNHETFYGVMKGRLDLENFSGQTPEAVRQDFHSTLLLCNLESVLTASTDAALQTQSTDHDHPKQVNRAVSFHALKDQLLPLLYSDLPAAVVIGKLQQWFAGSPVSVRESRKVQRMKFSWPRSYHFQRRVKNRFLNQMCLIQGQCPSPLPTRGGPPPPQSRPTVMVCLSYPQRQVSPTLAGFSASCSRKVSRLNPASLQTGSGAHAPGRGRPRRGFKKFRLWGTHGDCHHESNGNATQSPHSDDCDSRYATGAVINPNFPSVCFCRVPHHNQDAKPVLE